MIWSAALDPAILVVSAVGPRPWSEDAISLRPLAPWLTVVEDLAGSEHVLLSDGCHHIRLDVEEGRIAGSESVSFRYRIESGGSTEAALLPLRRFLSFCRLQQFVPALFPPDPLIGRGIEMLRVHDALEEGATYREIAAVLFGEERVADEWGGVSDSLRTRVKRLARSARAMAAGGYRHLLRNAGKK